MALCLSSCSGKELCKIKQIKRSASPDKKIDLIWIQKNCGATVAIAEQIYLAESGVELAALSDAPPIFIADRASGLDIFWQRDKVLVIKFDNARIFQFKNFWHSRDLDSFQYVVNISLEEKKY